MIKKKKTAQVNTSLFVQYGFKWQMNVTRNANLSLSVSLSLGAFIYGTVMYNVMKDSYFTKY